MHADSNIFHTSVEEYSKYQVYFNTEVGPITNFGLEAWAGLGGSSPNCENLTRMFISIMATCTPMARCSVIG